MLKRAKYTVPRENVYVGQVARIGDTYNALKTTGYVTKGVNYCLLLPMSIPLRSMLFTIDKNGLAHDLLYESPNYPVLDWANPDSINATNHNNNGIIIQSICHLDPLLKYYQYSQLLKYPDIEEIRRKFFNGHFALKHYDLFGYKRIKNPIRAKVEAIRTFDMDTAVKKCFAIDEEASYILPPEYFGVLDNYGNISFIKSFVSGRPMHAFVPPELEGKIKKLLP